MELCESSGCGLNAAGACTACDRRACARHLTVGGSTAGLSDSRIVVELGDHEITHDRLLEIWGEDPATLCVDCRNAQVAARRDEYVVALDLGLPGDDLSPVAELRALNRLFDPQWISQMQNAHHPLALDLRRLSEIHGATMARVRERLAALEPALREVGPARFAAEWVARSQTDRVPPVRIRTRWWRADERGWQAPAPTKMISVAGRWFAPASVTSYSSGRAEFESTLVVRSWRETSIGAEEWATVCSHAVQMYTRAW